MITDPSSDQMPSIITSVKPGMMMTCGPHRTPFTATGFGWCYGRTIRGHIYGVDFRTGELQPIEKTLPGFSKFAVYAETDDGFDLPQLARQRSLMINANNATIAMQAMFANRVTIEMAYWGACGASPDITRRTAFDSGDSAGCVITLSDDRRLGDTRGLTEEEPVAIAPMVEGTHALLDPQRQTLWLNRHLIPLIDCPALKFDAILRSQIATAFPGQEQNWAIVYRHADTRMIKASRFRWPSPSFICEPHARDVYLPDQAIDVDAGSVSLSVQDGELITNTADWHYDARVKLSGDHMIVRFDGPCWSHLAIRPERRKQIAAAIRQKFRTSYQITLTGIGDGQGA
jgi:hypothetical protein